MELRHLRYFVAVAETLHFGRAAEALGIAQPPLSQQIRQLEEELGIQLLHRTNKRQVLLTDAGQIILEEAHRTLAAAERVIQTARRAARGEVGRLDIGLASLASYTVALEILRTFRERFPHVSLLLTELQTADQVRKLCAGHLNLGFIYPPIDTDELTLECVQKEPLVAVLPMSHPLSAQEQLPLEALSNEFFILFPRHMGPGLYDQIVGLCRRSGFRPRVIQEANHIQTIVGLVSIGVGVSLLPASIQNLHRTGVVYRSLQTKDHNLVEMAVAYKRESQSDTLRTFLTVVREVVGQEKQGEACGVNS